MLNRNPQGLAAGQGPEQECDQMSLLGTFLLTVPSIQSPRVVDSEDADDIAQVGAVQPSGTPLSWHLSCVVRDQCRGWADRWREPLSSHREGVCVCVCVK